MKKLKLKFVFPQDLLKTLDGILHNLTLVTYNPKDYPVAELDIFRF